MSKRTKEQDKWHHRGYAAGVAIACAIVVDVWGEEVQAEEVMRATGLTTRAKMKRLGVDDYDLDRLKPVFKTLATRSKRRRAALCG